MTHYFRVYGHLVGLSFEQIKACQNILANYECMVDDHVLDFIHEGAFIDIDNDLKALESVLDAQVRGVVDIINHIDWEMTRCSLDQGRFIPTRIALDNALDTAYASEYGS